MDQSNRLTASAKAGPGTAGDGAEPDRLVELLLGLEEQRKQLERKQLELRLQELQLEELL